MNQSGWISVKENLPDVDTTVLIFATNSDPDVWIGYLDGDEWRTAEGHPAAVKFWMHLPDPPAIPKRKKARAR